MDTTPLPTDPPPPVPDPAPLVPEGGRGPDVVDPPAG